MRISYLIAALAIGACARVEPVDVDEDEVLNSLETPIESAASNDSASIGATDSQWSARSDQAGPWAGYGVPFSEAVFSARCEGGQLIMNTTEMPPTGAGRTTMSVSGQRIDENLNAVAREDGLPNTEASVNANSQWLDRLASASGNLSIQVGGSAPITVPIGEPLTSLVRDCRSGSTQVPASESEAAPATAPSTGS
jgi:hypothetical protein